MQDHLADERLVADLLQARDAARLTLSPSQRGLEFKLDRGYQVGNTLYEQLLKRGYRAVGRKIGFTNSALWERFNVSQPIWAHMYAETVQFAHEGFLRLRLDRMVAPRLEPEVVLKLRDAVPNDNPSIEELARCVEWAAIGFEIVDSHYSDWCFTASEAIADFGMHAALVVGTPWHVDSENPRHVATILRTFTVMFRSGMDFVAKGDGHNALGSPLLALAHLTHVVAAQSWATPLMPGDLITTGALTVPPPLRRGESFYVEVGGAPLAPLRLELEALED